VQRAGNQIGAVVLNGDEGISCGKGSPVHEDVRRRGIERAENFVERLVEIVKGTGGDENVRTAGFRGAVGEMDARFVALRGEFFREGPLVGKIVHRPGQVRRKAKFVLIGVEKIAHVTAEIEDAAEVRSDRGEME